MFSFGQQEPRKMKHSSGSPTLHYPGNETKKRDGYMDASCRAARRNSCEIKNDASNLAIKQIRSSKLQSVSAIDITVDEPKPIEFWGSLQYWQVIWVANYLSVVVVHDRRVDYVRSSRKIDDCGGRSRRLAASRSTSTTRTHG
jgi:hypothetical protein